MEHSRAPFLENLPAGHSRHVWFPLLVALSGMKRPPMHGVHWSLLLAPAVFPKVPAGHGMQNSSDGADDAELYLLLGHGVAMPFLHVEPGLQLSQLNRAPTPD